jgi:hypothetical protein
VSESCVLHQGFGIEPIKDSDIARVAFLGNLPAAAAATPSESANTNIGWVTDHKTGLYQEGCDLGGGFKYGPLYTLKQMRNTKGWLPDFRDSPGPQRFGDDLFVISFIQKLLFS